MADYKYVDLTSPEHQGYMKKYEDEDKYNASQTEGDNTPFIGLDRRSKWLAHDMGQLGHLIIAINAATDPAYVPSDYELVYVDFSYGPSAAAVFYPIYEYVTADFSTKHLTDYEIPSGLVLGMVFPVDSSATLSNFVYEIADSGTVDGSYYYILIGSSAVAITKSSEESTSLVSDGTAFGGRAWDDVRVDDYLYSLVPNTSSDMDYPTGQFVAFSPEGNVGRLNNWLRYKMFGDGFNKVWRWDNHITTWTDLTDNARFPYDISTGAPYQIVEQSDVDYLYMGLTDPFAPIYFEIETAGASTGTDNVLSLEYWNGSVWTTFDYTVVTPMADITVANPGVVTHAGHGFSNGDMVVYSIGTGLLNIPELDNGYIYYIVEVGTDGADCFRVDTSPTGTGLQFSGTGNDAQYFRSAYNVVDGTSVFTTSGTIYFCPIDTENTPSIPADWDTRTESDIGISDDLTDYYWIRLSVTGTGFDTTAPVAYTTTLPRLNRTARVLAVTDQAYVISFGLNDHFGTGVVEEQTHENLDDLEAETQIHHNVVADHYRTPKALGTYSSYDWSGSEHLEYVNRVIDIPYALFDSSKIPTTGELVECAQKSTSDPTRVFRKSENAEDGVLYGVCTNVTGTSYVSVLMRGPWYPTDEARANRITLFDDISGLEDYQLADLSPSEDFTLEVWDNGHVTGKEGQATEVTPEYHKPGDPDRVNIRRLGYIYRIEDVTGTSTYPFRLYIDTQNGINAALDLAYEYFTNPPPRPDIPSYPQYYETWGIAPSSTTAVDAEQNESRYLGLLNPDLGVHVAKLRSVSSNVGAGVLDQFLISESSFANDTLVNINSNADKDAFLTQYDPRVMCDTAVDAVPGTGAIQKPALVGVYKKSDYTEQYVDLVPSYYGGFRMPDRDWAQCQNQPDVALSGLYIDFIEYNSSKNYLTIAAAADPALADKNIWLWDDIKADFYAGTDSSLTNPETCNPMIPTSGLVVLAHDTDANVQFSQMRTKTAADAWAVATGDFLLWTSGGAGDEFFIGHDDTFETMYVNVTAAGACTYTVQYWNGASWLDLTTGHDWSIGTLDFAGPTDGIITFTAPSDWTVYDLAGLGGNAPNTGEIYWVRFTATGGAGLATTKAEFLPLGDGSAVIPKAAMFSYEGFSGIGTPRLTFYNVTMYNEDNWVTDPNISQYGWRYTFERVLYDDGTGSGTYTDLTNEAKTQGGTPFKLLSNRIAGTEDVLLIGATAPFYKIYFLISTPGGGTGQLTTTEIQYWDTTVVPPAWTDVTAITTDDTYVAGAANGSLHQSGILEFTAPAAPDWGTNVIDGSALYWIKIQLPTDVADATVVPYAYMVVNDYKAYTGQWFSDPDPAIGTAWTEWRLLPMFAGGIRLKLSGRAKFNSFGVVPMTNESWTSLSALGTERVDTSAALLNTGKVLVAGGAQVETVPPTSTTKYSELYNPTTGLWSYTGDLFEARGDAKMVTLSSGKAMLIGGTDGSSPLDTCEIYNPTTEAWNDMRVVIYDAGGATYTDRTTLCKAKGTTNFNTIDAVADYIYVGSTERFNSVKFDWVSGGGGAGGAALIDYWNGSAWANAPAGFTVTSDTTVSGGQTLSQDGSIKFTPLQAWSSSGTSSLPSALNTYGDGTFWIRIHTTGIPGAMCVFNWINPQIRMAYAREQHTATVLLDGRVLVAGGWTSGSDWENHAEVYDPTTGTWTTQTGTLATKKGRHQAILWPTNGNVYLIGGATTGGASVKTVDLYTYVAAGTGSLSASTAMSFERQYFGASLYYTPGTPDVPKILVSGGITLASAYLSDTEIFDGSTWSAGPALATKRAYHEQVTMLDTHNVLICGGENDVQFSLSATEMFTDSGSGTSVAFGSGEQIDARERAAIVDMTDGTFMFVGGCNASGVLNSAEVFDSSVTANTTVWYDYKKSGLNALGSNADDATIRGAVFSDDASFGAGHLDLYGWDEVDDSGSEKFWSSALVNYAEFADQYPFDYVPTDRLGTIHINNIMSNKKLGIISKQYALPVYTLADNTPTGTLPATATITRVNNTREFWRLDITGSTDEVDEFFGTTSGAGAIDVVRFLPGLRLNIKQIGATDDIRGLIPYRVEKDGSGNSTIYFRYPANQDAWGTLSVPTETSTLDVSGCDWEWYHVDSISVAPSIAILNEKEAWIDISKKCSDRAYGMFFSIKDATTLDAVDVSLAQSQFYDGSRTLSAFGVGTEIYRYLSEGDSLRFFIKPRSSSPANIER